MSNCYLQAVEVVGTVRERRDVVFADSRSLRDAAELTKELQCRRENESRPIMNVSELTTSAPDMELGHWVTGSMGHLGHLSRPGHRVIILTRCETRVFRKKPKIKM